MVIQGTRCSYESPYPIILATTEQPYHDIR